MKKNFLKLTACAAVSALAISASAGDDEHTSSTSQTHSDQIGAQTQTSGSDLQSQNWNKPVLLSKLQSANVKSSQDENLGEIEEIVINPQTGKIEFVVLGRGGFLGIGEKHVAVPWKALNLQSEDQLAVNVDKERLRSAPTLESRSDYSQLTQPDYTVTIYRFFAVPVGGAEDMETQQESEAVGGADDLESDTRSEALDNEDTQEDQESPSQR